MFNTRIAPSPTGDMHMGTARTAYFNWLAARGSGGKFILRIDDTDADRNDMSKVDDIVSVMDWLGLDYDAMVYQSDRNDHYHDMAQLLISAGFAIRLDDGSVILNYSDWDNFPRKSWHDDIAGDINLGQRDFDYISTMPLIKGDGNPTYNFATVCDDLDPSMGINYIIRGVDHTKNTGKQIVLYHLFNLILTYNIAPMRFAHTSLLFKDGKKLSKRAPSGGPGDGSMLKYMSDGTDPDAMLNFLLRLGWGPRVDDKSTAILTRDRALELFLDGGKMKSSKANVDLQKLASFDRKYKGRKRNGQL